MKITRQQLRLLIESVVNASSLMRQYEDASKSEYPSVEMPGVLLNALNALKTKKDEYTVKINEIENNRSQLPSNEIEAMERFADQALDDYYEIYKIVEKINFHPSLQKELFDSGDYARYGTKMKTSGSQVAFKSFEALRKELQEFEP